MQQSNAKNMQALKCLVRFLNGCPSHGRQAEQQVAGVFSDRDWAGCAKTWPTSSPYVRLGGHLIASSTTTQNVGATSSGEAEFYAMTKSASRALGAVAMAADTAKVVKPRVRVDATASKGIASRRGVGRVRHLHTRVLWVQVGCAPSHPSRYGRLGVQGDVVESGHRSTQTTHEHHAGVGSGRHGRLWDPSPQDTEVDQQLRRIHALMKRTGVEGPLVAHGISPSRLW